MVKYTHDWEYFRAFYTTRNDGEIRDTLVLADPKLNNFSPPNVPVSWLMAGEDMVNPLSSDDV